MAQIKSFFDIANIITKKLPYPSEEDIQKFTVQWMLNNYFSCSQQLAPLAAQLSSLKLSNKEYFDMLYYGVPKINTFIKYSAQKAKADTQIKNLCTYYMISPEIAKQYLPLLSAAELARIDELYEEKPMKKEKVKRKK